MDVRSALVVVMLLLSACAHTGDDGRTAADCAVSVRYEGTVYEEVGFTNHPAERVGDADQSSCDDNGPDPRGSYFADDPPEVEVWSFPGYDAAQVLGVRVSGSDFRVYFAEDLPTAVETAIRDSGLLDAGQQ